MRITDWTRPGIKIKRWMTAILCGITIISIGLSYVFKGLTSSTHEKISAIILIFSGIIIIGFSVFKATKRVLDAINEDKGFKSALDFNRLSKMLVESRILIKGPKIVVLGGGTGLSTMLRGLKNFSTNITAVVTVADDGGGSGVLREDLGMLPPGDIRNCILALADTEPILEKLLQYRFEEGRLKGQSFGNLFLAAMNGISSNFEEAVKKMSSVLAVKGKVLPVTLENVELIAELEDGYKVVGESNIGHHNDFHAGKIKRVSLKPENAKPLGEVLQSIKDADAIIIGPGSLYTSIMPNLIVDGINQTIKNSDAPKIYISNLMTQDSETEEYTLSDHIKAIEEHSYKGIIDYCIVNTADLPKHLVSKYKEKNAVMVKIDKKKVEKMGIKIYGANLLSIKNDLARHNHINLSETLIKIIIDNVLKNDKKREIDSYYIKYQLKKSRINNT